MKLKALAITLVAIIMSACMSSCGGHKNGRGDSSTEYTEDGSDVYEENGSPEIHIEPVFTCEDSSETTTDCFIDCFVRFVVMDSDGNPIKFDNDADYTDYCAIIKFIQNADGSRFYFMKQELREKYNVPEFKGDHPMDKWKAWLAEHKEDAQNINKEIVNYWRSIIDGSIKYLNGDKDQIADPKIFEKIDRAYYNNHPDEHYYHCEHSEYDYKRYANEEGYGLIHARSYGTYTGSQYYVFPNGKELPHKTCIFTEDWFDC